MSGHDLVLFIKRADKHPNNYLMLNVNELSFKLQHSMYIYTFVQVYLAIQRDRNDEHTIHFIETVPSMLEDMLWIEEMMY